MAQRRGGVRRVPKPHHDRGIGALHVRGVEIDNGQLTHIKRMFGISKRQYLRLHKFQGAVCAICKTNPGPRRLAVDHDHETNNIRGLLCSGCNTMLGLARDSPRILAAAIIYLEDNGIMYPGSSEE